MRPPPAQEGRSRPLAGADVSSYLSVLEDEARRGNELLCVLTTHHHMDHAGGNQAIQRAYPGVAIYGWSSPSNANLREKAAGDDWAQYPWHVPMAITHELPTDCVLQLGALTCQAILCYIISYVIYYIMYLLYYIILLHLGTLLDSPNVHPHARMVVDPSSFLLTRGLQVLTLPGHTDTHLGCLPLTTPHHPSVHVVAARFEMHGIDYHYI